MPNNISQPFQEIDYSIDLNKFPLPEKTDQLIAELYSNLLTKIRPNWTLKNLRYKAFSEGLTNRLYGFWHSQNENSKISDNDNYAEAVVLRINGAGTENIIDRDRELKVWKELSDRNAAGKLFLKYNSGILFEFCRGHTIQMKDNHYKQDNIWRSISQQMAETHNLEMPIFDEKRDSTPAWTYLCNHFLGQVKSFENLQRKEDFYRNSMTIIDSIPKKSQKYNSNKLVFCHNDLLGNNILFETDNNKSNFIDFEYAGYNYAAFDIGNHFNEFTGTDEFEYLRDFPDPEFRKKWIENYIKNREGNQEFEVDQKDVEDLHYDVQVMCLASHLTWAIWALFQNENSDSEDFDYAEYSGIRIAEMVRFGKTIGVEF